MPAEPDPENLEREGGAPVAAPVVESVNERIATLWRWLTAVEYNVIQLTHRVDLLTRRPRKKPVKSARAGRLKKPTDRRRDRAT